MSGGTPFSSNGQELFTDNNPASVKLKTGNSTIGKVTMDSLPAGTNKIGSVELVSGTGGKPSFGNYPANDGWGTSDTVFSSASFNGAFNGSSWDRLRNNQDLVLMSSLARTSSSQSAVQTNHNGNALIVVINVTAIDAGATLRPVICGYDVNGKFYALHPSVTNITAVGQYVYMFSPNALDITGNIKSAYKTLIPRRFYLYMTHDQTGSITYDANCTLLV